MGQFLPLFMPHPLLSFHDEKEVNEDMEKIKLYFEHDDSSQCLELLDKINKKWINYIDDLLRIRRIKIFHTEDKIPDEEEKLKKYCLENNILACEMDSLYSFRANISRSWPVKELEDGKKQYLEWKKIQKMGETQLNYLLYESIKELYYPRLFFDKYIYRYEEKYKEFKFDFLEFMRSEGLYISYLIFKKEGNEKVFKNFQNYIINRYIPKPVFSMSIYGLIHFFIFNGNDSNGTSKFFTRRMKDDIYREGTYALAITNNYNGEGYKYAFNNFFYANPSSRCNIKDPLNEKTDMEPKLIEQAFFNHLIGNYAASSNLLFSIIEGIIWDISVAEHLKNSNIYILDSDLTNRDIHNRTLIKIDKTPLPKTRGYPTLKELLELTKMREIINIDFFNMFVNEIYPLERNPILHGTNLDYNDPWQSSKLLLVLEYLFNLIKEMDYKYPEQLDPTGYWTTEKNNQSNYRAFAIKEE